MRGYCRSGYSCPGQQTLTFYVCQSEKKKGNSWLIWAELEQCAASGKIKIQLWRKGNSPVYNQSSDEDEDGQDGQNPTNHIAHMKSFSFKR